MYREFSFSSYHEKRAHFLLLTTGYLLYSHVFVYIIVCCHVYKKIEHSKFGGFWRISNSMAVRRVLCDNDCRVGEGVSLDGCVGYRRLKDALQMHFKYDNFWPGQLEALLPVVHGRDVFVCQLVEESHCAYF